MSSPAAPAALMPRSGILLTVILTLLAALLGAFGGLSRVDQTLYDQSLNLLSRPAQPDIVLVTIDDASIDKLGRWPWPRQTHAALLEPLREARAVGLDIIFSEPDRADPAADATLAQAIRKHGRVALPLILDNLTDPSGYQPPIAPLAKAAAALGFINIPVDDDGVVRRGAWQRQIGDTALDHFSLALMRAGGQMTPANHFAERQSAQQATALIPFRGPPGHVAMVPYSDVLEGRIDPAFFRDRYVLVGSWATGLTDAFPTPMSHRANGMAGMEIIANMLQAARDNDTLRAASVWENALATALPVLLLCLIMRRGSPRLALTWNLLLLVCILPASALMLWLGQLWFAPSAALISLMLCYPIWSWRSQEAMLRYMDGELARLRTEPLPLHDPLRTPRPRLLDNRSVEYRLAQFRHAMALVRDLRQFLTDGLDGMPDASLVFDPRQGLQFRNRAAVQFFRQLRMAAPEVGQSARAVLDALLPESMAGEPVLAAMQQAALEQARSGWSVDIETRTRQGRDVIIKCAPIHSDQGVFAGTILTLSDISDIRQAERQREETLRFISHDMRAPQNGILALVAMHQDKSQTELPEQTLQRIAQLSRRTLHLVDGFVQLTRAESMKIQPIELDLADLLREVCDDFWAPAQARAIELRIAEPLPVAFVCGDQTLLRRALANLLDNAIKYSPQHSTIDCTLEAEDQQWIVNIQDQGPGMSPQDAVRIFQPFSRMAPGIAADAGGAGLGLAFVRTVAERHQGSVQVHSTLGAGSRFSLSLPAAPTENDAVASAACPL